MTSGETTCKQKMVGGLTVVFGSPDPAAEKTCERLIDLVLETDEDNAEALRTLASVRLSQQRPDEARQCPERAWTGWKYLDPGACFVRYPHKSVPPAYRP